MKLPEPVGKNVIIIRFTIYGDFEGLGKYALSVKTDISVLLAYQPTVHRGGVSNCGSATNVVTPSSFLSILIFRDFSERSIYLSSYKENWAVSVSQKLATNR